MVFYIGMINFLTRLSTETTKISNNLLTTKMLAYYLKMLINHEFFLIFKS